VQLTTASVADGGPKRKFHGLLSGTLSHYWTVDSTPWGKLLLQQVDVQWPACRLRNMQSTPPRRVWLSYMHAAVALLAAS